MGIIVEEELEEYRKYLKSNLKVKRYHHSIGVSYTAASLAMRYGVNVKSAQIAGLLHDCAKCYSGQELLNKCIKAGIPISKAQKNNPELLHADYGAYIASNKLNITDSDIINAIKYHTTGRANMSMLEKIIFISDFIEPHRSEFDRLELIRREAFINIDKAIVMACESTLKFLENNNSEIDDSTFATYNYYNTSDTKKCCS